jgi:predicted Zn-dependent peptidase
MSPRSFKQCLDILSREIERLTRTPLSDKDLDLVKGQLRGNILLSSDQMETRQESIGRNEIVFGRYVPVEEIIDEINRVSGERVHTIAQRIFTREKEAMVTLSRSKPRSKLSVF